MEVEDGEALVWGFSVALRKKDSDRTIIPKNCRMKLPEFVTIACQQVVFRRIRVRGGGRIGLLGPRDESKGRWRQRILSLGTSSRCARINRVAEDVCDETGVLQVVFEVTRT